MYRYELKQNVKIILSINYNVWLYLEQFENKCLHKIFILKLLCYVIDCLLLSFAGFISFKIVSYKILFFTNAECDNINMLLRF